MLCLCIYILIIQPNNLYGSIQLINNRNKHNATFGNDDKFIYNNAHNDVIKQRLDNFVMHKRKTNFFIPGYHINKHNKYIDSRIPTDVANIRLKKYQDFTEHPDTSNQHNYFHDDQDIRDNILNNHQQILRENSIDENYFIDGSNKDSVENINNNDKYIDSRIPTEEANIRPKKYQDFTKHPDTLNQHNYFYDDQDIRDNILNNHQQILKENSIDENNPIDASNKNSLDIPNNTESFSYDFDVDSLTINQKAKLLHILRTQRDLIMRINKVDKQDEVKRKWYEDFNDIIDEVEQKQKAAMKLSNYTRFTFEEPSTTKIIVTRTTETTTPKPSTIVSIINEVDIKMALKNNPFVRRILNMANMKRQKYINQNLIKNNDKKQG